MELGLVMESKPGPFFPYGCLISREPHCKGCGTKVVKLMELKPFPYYSCGACKTIIYSNGVRWVNPAAVAISEVP